MKLLENNALDLGLIAKPDGDSFYFYSLGPIEDIFVATKTYLDNLMLRENTGDIFSCANIMLMDKENVSRKYINDYFKTNSINPKNILEISNMDLLIEFAKTSLGVACVIKEFVTKELEEGTLIQIPLRIPVNKREVGFSHIKNAYLSESMQKFMNYISGGASSVSASGVVS
jgi:DNA-binding transcriptional LysR family regulator